MERDVFHIAMPISSPTRTSKSNNYILKLNFLKLWRNLQFFEGVLLNLKWNFSPPCWVFSIKYWRLSSHIQEIWRKLFHWESYMGFLVVSLRKFTKEGNEIQWIECCNTGVHIMCKIWLPHSTNSSTRATCLLSSTFSYVAYGSHGCDCAFSAP
jgi:hypothetical protein